MKNGKIEVQGKQIGLLSVSGEDYISLTDMVKNFGDESMIYSWMRNRNTIELLGIWEELYNPNFKGHEFVTFKSQAGLHSFNLTPRKWIEATDAIGLISKAGRYGGGTFAHKDIAFEFANEADVLNVALFGKTAKEWRESNPGKEGNLRDEASLEQLVVLSNMESINSVLIKQNISQSERLIKLNEIAISQMKSLVMSKGMKKLKDK